MHQKLLFAFAVSVGFLDAKSNSYGAIVSISGDIQQVNAPASVAVSAVQSDTTGIVFQEQSAHTLLADTRVSIPGTVGVYDDSADMSPTDILAGTTVNSYLLHFDQVNGSQNYTGTVAFSNTIVGVMLLPFALGESDAELGATGTVYPTNSSGGTFVNRRGLDFGESTQLDALEIVDSTTIEFSVTSANLIDQIRVVTSATAVPEPSTAGFMIFVVLFGTTRRKRVR